MVKYYKVISLILFYLFLKKGSNTMNCAICGKKLKVIAVNKVMVRDGDYICFDCCKDAGHNPFTWTGNMKTSVWEIKQTIEARKAAIAGNIKTTNNNDMSADNIQLIREYKKLLDDGLIDEDEFKRKKEQILFNK